MQQLLLMRRLIRIGDRDRAAREYLLNRLATREYTRHDAFVRLVLIFIVGCQETIIHSGGGGGGGGGAWIRQECRR